MKILGKRNTIIVIIVILLIITGFISYKLFADRHSGFDIEIKNNTGENISGLTITYKNIVKDISLPEIGSGKTYKININPKEDFNENSMVFVFKRKKERE